MNRSSFVKTSVYACWMENVGPKGDQIADRMRREYSCLAGYSNCLASVEDVNYTKGLEKMAR